MTISPHNDQIEIRLVSDDIAPFDVRAPDLAELLKAADTLVVSAVLSERPDLTREDVYLALSEVKAGSVRLYFSSPIPQIVVPAFERVASLVADRRFHLIPPEGREAVRRIATFTRKNRCKAELRTPNRNTVLATVERDLLLPIAARLHMQTTIYGRVLEAGGKHPNAHIETLQGQVIVCQGTQSQVKELAGRLYDLVGIIGTARGDVDTLEIYDFKIDEILPFAATSIVEAVRELSEVAAPYYDNVDAAEYVQSLRADSREA